MAFAAKDGAVDVKFFFAAEGRFFESNVKLGLEVIAGLGPGPAASSTAPSPLSTEDVTEDVPEDVTEVTEVSGLESTAEAARAAAHLGAVVAELVVHPPLVIIQKNVSSM